MDKYVILIPLNYNDGKAVPKKIIREALDALYDLADGCTIEGKVKGAYRMKSGARQDDVLLKVWVMIAPDHTKKLKEMVRQLCVRLGQESMWLEKSNSIIELVEPGSDVGDLPHD
jgi:hypothetical protein